MAKRRKQTAVRVICIMGDIRLEAGDEHIELSIEQARELADLLLEAAEAAGGDAGAGLLETETKE